METLVFNKFRDTRIAKSLLAPELTRLLEFLTGYTKELVTSEIFNNSFFQSVTLDKASDKKDPQQNFHIDTFYPAFKFWYFPEPVTLKDAPFEYVPGSHCLPLEVLTHLSDRYEDNAFDLGYSISPDNMEGSLRATDHI